MRNEGGRELVYIAGREVEAFRPGRRHDVSRVAGEKQPSVAQRLRDETAQRRDALFDRRTGAELRRRLYGQPCAQLVPEALVAPLAEVVVERTLHVAAAPGRGTHAAEREPALVARIDELVRYRRHVREHTEPAERIHALVRAELRRRDRP